jgi:hypothetical protein
VFDCALRFDGIDPGDALINRGRRRELQARLGLVRVPTSFRTSGRNGNQSPVVYVDARHNNTMLLRPNKLDPVWRRLLKNRYASMLADA